MSRWKKRLETLTVAKVTAANKAPVITDNTAARLNGIVDHTSVNAPRWAARPVT